MSWGLPAASEGATRIDEIFFTLLGVTGAVTMALAILAIVFLVRYRRGTHVDRSNAPANNPALEIAWTVTPLVIFLGFFGWGAAVFAGLHRGGAATEVFAVGKQWMWWIQHANGRREVDELHLPVNQPARVVLATQDVIHSFYVPAFRVKQDAVPGRYTELYFTPTRVGTYELRCSEYCGTQHARMAGRVVVMAPEEYERWLAQGDGGAPLAARGFATFTRLGCGGCHDSRSTVHAPSLLGLYGHEVRLADGRRVVADETYLRDSILLPKRDVVAGFAPVMPTYDGQVGEGELLELVAYIRSLGEPPR